MRRKAMPLVLAAMVVTAGGCGSSSSSSSSGASSPASTSGAPIPTSTSGTTTSGGPTFTNSSNCQQLISLRQKFVQAIQSVSNGGHYDPAAVAKAFQALAAAAPAEIRPDLQVIANAFVQFAAALQKVGFKPGTPPTQQQIAGLQQAVQVFNQPQFKTATQHLQAWARKNCAGIIPKGTSTG